ncbi:GPI biosynthesis protein family Pig-F-domain-containing protein [Rhodofomes roseus]|uniref:GPI biosynthesis protein family Pig-F-domain-containing protein n=1 Tax=Rhodofomes roseus TaxID=34475 RepID=A0ABQ8JY76_9APHY|nr:GPI biosynthesis protein family Pig-F-domain-containing protein [Rhodofomes roseus]KAH9829215.1 GPI biosynthesis protein family Pig-F-domain-containing protein [Rhodofomes roseus]
MSQPPLRLRKAQVAKTAIPKTLDPQAAAKQPRADPGPTPFFPLARYASVTGVHTCLLGFTALYLPRSSLSFFTSLNFFETGPESTAPSGEAPPDALHLLTSNPASTVSWLCAGALLLQPWWAACIKSWSREASLQLKGGRDAAEVSKHKLDRSVLNSQRVVDIRHASLTTFAASLAFYVIIVLFGAPLASHALHTYFLALLLALLIAWTPAYILGAPTLGSRTEALVIRLTWIRLFAELRPRTAIERAIVYPAIGAVFGCWSGAIPIGLDWERPWQVGWLLTSIVLPLTIVRQAWPLTSAYGAISGYVVGSLAALLVSTVLWLAETDLLARPFTSAKQPKSRHR